MREWSVPKFFFNVGSVLLMAAVGAVPSAHAAGVTVITHGLNGDVDGWITAMANGIPGYSRFAGTNFTCYELSLVPSGTNYTITASRVAGSQPFAPESGEIIVKLDWSLVAGGDSYDTYQVA